MIAATLQVLVCLILAQYASAQALMPAKVLTPSTTRDVQVPAFAHFGNPACDKEGNMYFHVGGFSGVEILRLSADGSQGKIFKEPKAAFSNFSVTAGGNVYVLAGMDGELKLLRFDEDTDKSEVISLHLPQDVTPSTMVASDSRTLLFFGFYDRTAPPDLKGKSYMALLDTSSGAVRQEVHVSVPGLDMAKLASAQIQGPEVAVGDDGNFYVAGSNEILVLAQDGSLVRRIPFDNPVPKGVVTRLQVSAGLIILEINREDDKHLLHDSYLVLLNSGGVVGYYEPSEVFGGWGEACYSPKEGLTFLKVEKRQLKLLTAHFP